MQVIAEKTVERLCLYRRLLTRLCDEGDHNIFSHKLAEEFGFTAAQVRRDVMAVGYSGSPRRGYSVCELIEAIDSYLDTPEGQRVVLVGLGNLGRALAAYFAGRREKLSLVAGFDNDPNRANRVISGCRVHPMDELGTVVAGESVDIAMIAVPSAAAQPVVDQCIKAGIRGFLNFAPAPIRVPPFVYVSDVDLAMALEKVAFFSRQADSERCSRP